MRSWLLRFLDPWHLFQGQHSPQPQGARKGGHRDPLGRLNHGALEVQTAQSHQLLHCHISKEPHTPCGLQAIIPCSPGSLLLCCDGGTALQFTTTSSSVSSQGGPCSSPHPQLLGDTIIILCPRAATLPRCLKDRSKSHFFLKNNHLFLVCQPHHPPLCDCSPPRGQQRTKGNRGTTTP